MTSATGPARTTRLLTGAADLLFGPHGVDRYLEVFRPTLSVRDARASVVEARRRTADTVTLTLRPNHRWGGFIAGQYTAVTVEVDGVRRTRCFSPANSQHARGHLELTVKATPDGSVSRYLVDHAAPGMTVGLSEAAGDFVLPDERPERLLLIGGGSGMTPIMSMVRTLADEGHTGGVTVIQYCLRPEDLLYHPELLLLRDRLPGLRLLVGHPETPGAGDLDGNFGAAHLESAGVDPTTTDTYVCGPEPLMAGVRATFEAHGAGELVRTESFTLAPPPDPDAAGTLRFTDSGLDVANDGRPILDQAEAAGLTPKFGCRRGICHTCVVERHSGLVRDLRDDRLCDPDATHIRICVNTPAGDVEVAL